MNYSECENHNKNPVLPQDFLFLYISLTKMMVKMPKNHFDFAKKPWEMPNLLANKGFSTTFAEYIYKNSTN